MRKPLNEGRQSIKLICIFYSLKSILPYPTSYSYCDIEKLRNWGPSLPLRDVMWGLGDFFLFCFLACMHACMHGFAVR